ncbi:MAG: branched-chain amino acid ABC transporter permease [Acidimicrobiia bacterium]|nr:branched-chain amino acid ABC transporter permease [Acidimicrobiia bacterium]MDH3470308.1 branched-chain amino acid ABC transporter permease [Acidimicrobiia bacterium]
MTALATLEQQARTTRNKQIALALLLLALLIMPLGTQVADQTWVTDSRLFQFTQVFMLIALASNWNLTGGFIGYVDFGHAVFFGLGAYATGVMMTNQHSIQWPFWSAVIVGAIVAAIFAVMIGFPTLRLKGPYFSIAMLGTFVAMREIIRVSKPVTGGGVGLTLPPYLNRALFYYLTLGLAVAIIMFVWWIRRSEFGSSLIAIREDEVGAEMRGINTTLHKITIFVIAGFLTGIVGGMWAYQNTFIDPDVVFVDSRTIDLVMMTMLGGLGTVAGPVVGAAAIYWLRDVVWAAFFDWHLMIQGSLLIGIVLFVPTGLVGLFRRNGSGTTLQSLWGRYFGTRAEHPNEPGPGEDGPIEGAQP